MKYKVKCRECGVGELKILGAAMDVGGIDVVCLSCGETYAVEPDGLGDGGMEWVEAMRIESEKGFEARHGENN